MNNRLTWLCVLFTLLWLPAAQAQQTVDVSKITCNQFMFGNIADSRTITLWLFGYYDGALKKTVLDVASMQNSSRDLERYCMDHSDALIMDAAKNIFETGK
jgi:acid stress chaperone HdeB